MRETRVTLPELGLIAGTRVMLGIGAGFLLANWLAPDQRRAAGWALLIAGAASTIPLAFEVLGGGRLSAPAKMPEQEMEPSFSEESIFLREQAVLGGF
jgi:hypothetical protein